jgi:hypothetical protein
LKENPRPQGTPHIHREKSGLSPSIEARPLAAPPIVQKIDENPKRMEGCGSTYPGMSHFRIGGKTPNVKVCRSCEKNDPHKSSEETLGTVVWALSLHCISLSNRPERKSHSASV